MPGITKKEEVQKGVRNEQGEEEEKVTTVWKPRSHGQESLLVVKSAWHWGKGFGMSGPMQAAV